MYDPQGLVLRTFSPKDYEGTLIYVDIHCHAKLKIFKTEIKTGNLTYLLIIKNLTANSNSSLLIKVVF